MDFKTVSAVCLVLWLLVRVDGVRSRPIQRSMTEAAVARVQRKEQIIGSGSERGPTTGSLKKQNGGLEQFVSKAIRHFRLHAPPAMVYTFPITGVAFTLLCCITRAIERRDAPHGGL